MMNYTNEQIRALAALAAADYAAACTGPTIRGKNGEKNLRGASIEEVAEKNGISVEEAKHLTVDLSKATFEELPPHWQETNVESARGMIDLLAAFAENGNDGAAVIKAVMATPDFNVQARYAARLHEAWLRQPQNAWALGGPLDVPFADLPPEEQAKDVQQLTSLYKWLVSLN